MDLTEEKRKAIIKYLDTVESIVENLTLPHSIEEYKTKSAFLDEKIKELENLEEVIKLASPEIELSDYENIKLRLIKLEVKIDLLDKKIVTRWEVLIIFFILLGGLSAIIAIYNFMSKYSFKKDFKQKSKKEE